MIIGPVGIRTLANIYIQGQYGLLRLLRVISGVYKIVTISDNTRSP